MLCSTSHADCSARRFYNTSPVARDVCRNRTGTQSHPRLLPVPLYLLACPSPTSECRTSTIWKSACGCCLSGLPCPLLVLLHVFGPVYNPCFLLVLRQQVLHFLDYHLHPCVYVIILLVDYVHVAELVVLVYCCFHLSQPPYVQCPSQPSTQNPASFK